MADHANELRLIADDPELSTPRREAANWALGRIRELEAALVKARGDALKEAAQATHEVQRGCEALRDACHPDEPDRCLHTQAASGARHARIAILALKGQAVEREVVLDQLVADAQEQGMGYALRPDTEGGE